MLLLNIKTREMPNAALSTTFVMLLCAGYAQSQSATGSLQGLVTDAQGTPLAGAQVRYQRVFRSVRATNGQPVRAPGEAVVSNQVQTNSQGAFTAPALPPGDYLLCASVASAAYLDPCKWATSLRVTVSANAASRQNIALTKGVFLKIRVNDPLGLLPRALDSPLRAGKLSVGIQYANGAYLGAPNTAVDSTGRDYQMTIPIGVPLKLWLFSSDIALTDTGGKPVNTSGTLIPFQASADQDQVLTVTVSGPATVKAK